MARARTFEMERLTKENAALFEENAHLRDVASNAELVLNLADKQKTRVAYRLADDSTGTVLSCVFDTQPGSYPHVLLSGRFTPPTDGDGRIFFDCSQPVWEQVVDFSRSGAIPEGRMPSLLAQARLWNVTCLVDALEARTPGVAFFKDLEDGQGFTARFNFVDVDPASDARRALKVRSPALDQEWGVQIRKDCVCVYPVEGYTAGLWPSWRLCTVGLALKDESVQQKQTSQFYGLNPQLSYAWSGWGYTLDQLVSAQIARFEGALVVELEVTKTRQPIGGKGVWPGLS